MTAARLHSTVAFALIVAVSVGVLLVAAGVVAQPTFDTNVDSWPMEGHDSGQTAYNPAAVGPSGDVGPGWISVTGYGPGTTVEDDRVFVAGGERRGTVSAYDVGDGTREWRTELGDAIDSKPVVDGDVVYVQVVEYRGRDVVEDRHEIVALNVATGAVEWQFEAEDDRYAYTTLGWKTLAVADGALYVAGENYESAVADERGFVLSIDADGEERWRTDLDAPSPNRPAIADGTVVTTAEADVVAFDVETGDERWRATHPESHELSAPAAVDGAVYVNARTPLELALETGAVTTTYDLSGRAAQPIAVTDEQLFVPGGTTREWMPTRLYAVERATGDVEWSYGSSSELSSRPVAASETVFVGGWDGVLYALDRETGEEWWTYEISREYMINNEPAVVGETIYVGPVDNRVYALVEGGDARDPAVIAYLSRWLPILGDFAGFFAVVALVYLGIGIPFALVSGAAVFGLITGFGISQAPIGLVAARVFRVPFDSVTRRQTFAVFLLASVGAALGVGAISAVTFGTFPINGLLGALAVFGGIWALLAYRLLPTHADALELDVGQIRRQWGLLLAGYGLVVGVVYPLVVFVVLMGIYFT